MAKVDELVRWVERRDALGFPLKHKELDHMVVAIQNGKNGVPHHRLGDHFTSHFLKRHNVSKRPTRVLRKPSL